MIEEGEKSGTNRLKIPVNLIVDNIAVLRFAISENIQDFDTFIASMQRRSEWNLHIITQIM